MLHVRYEGRSFDLDFKELGLHDNASDGQIKSRLASFLEIPQSNLNQYTVDRRPNGNWVVHPEAVYG
jgi:hypothetical protein